MPTEREEKKKILMEHAALAAKEANLLQEDPELLLFEIAVMVHCARFLYGKEAVESAVHAFQARFDDIDAALKAGMCTACFIVPVVSGKITCDPCDKKQKEAAAGIFLLCDEFLTDPTKKKIH